MAAAVRVLHESQISPSPWLPSQPPQPLSFLDAIWLPNSVLVERLFFYDFPHPVSHFIDHKLPILIKTLSLTLHHFYPLAGSIRPSADFDDGQFEIAYEEGDSVTLTIAEFTGEDFHNISGYHPRNFENLRLLVPKPKKSSSCGQFPPISIQITLFQNQGLCICFAINHVACDGSGTMGFIRSWATACRSTEPTLHEISRPFLDRSIIIDTHGIQRKMFQHKRVFEEYLKKQDTLPVSDPSLVSATFTLCKDHITQLKERVQAKGEEEGKPLFHISTFVVTCAYVWRCLVKARAYDGDSQQYFVCVVDWRSRMRPPLPRNYFGNCLGGLMVELSTKELVGKNGNELAAMEIGKSIDGLRGRDVGEVLTTAFGRLLENERRKSLSVAGSPKLMVYEVDFGWGRPAKVEISSINETRAISLAESREEEGGVEIGLVLPEEEMNRFGKNFTCGLVDI
ncbi:phenolic glucoside malonyltransferase 1 [Dendrobium catenatum]|uniref:Malonyl-coenzyme A:anthocyanin 3-O-glucoside-6''-O-malonyltransferase n=1 Tax=Dendrobium catenatum TaxID=906689 RepID=A0A2I0WH20_9ASPA|nr:phenolic glucoside malonyltransferase 1 [Dendrobium catenatum]PKU74963.1 Malonyl-coenzyme A:anthocyanin 3-O-glucoside-6''-O-malonyltransferase [Dendrobium catenatum]